MSEIILLHTSGVNPAEAPATDASGPSILIAKKTKAVGMLSGCREGADADSTLDPGSCVTAELPVYSGAGQIHNANRKPA